MHEWLADQLVAAMRWQLANPGAPIEDGPEIPLCGHRLWKIFNDLHNTRAAGFAPCPISHAEILTYATAAREPIRPFEVEIIRKLDAAYLETAAARQSGDSAPPKVSARPMSSGLFDALF